MLALLLYLQPIGFGTFAEPASGAPGVRSEKTAYSTGSSGTCSDYRAWKGHEEKDCAYYAAEGWCPKYKEDFSPSGVKAKDACCACGGGIKDADKTCEAIGYKPDEHDGLGKACESIGYKQEDALGKMNELLTQLAQSAAQRNILELMSAKAAGRKAAELKAAGFAAAALKAAGFSAAELKAAGFSAAELKAAGIFTTKSELEAALYENPRALYSYGEEAELKDDTSGIENWDVSLIDDFSRLVSFATPRAWPSLARSCRRAATRGRAPRARMRRLAAAARPRRSLTAARGRPSPGALRRVGVRHARARSGRPHASLAHRRARARRVAVLPRELVQRRPLQVGRGPGDGLLSHGARRPAPRRRRLNPARPRGPRRRVARSPPRARPPRRSSASRARSTPTSPSGTWLRGCISV